MAGAQVGFDSLSSALHTLHVPHVAGALTTCRHHGTLGPWIGPAHGFLSCVQ